MNEIVVNRATPADVDVLGKLSDRVFRSEFEEGTSMPVEFGPLFSPDNAENLYFVKGDGVPVSLVGMMPGKVHIQGSTVSVVSMGSVCTLASYRKHHFASKMVEQAIGDFSPTTSVLLVSGGLPIYRRVGCVDFGHYLRASIGPVLVQSANVDTTVLDGEYAVADIHRLYGREPLRFSRTLHATSALMDTLRAQRFRAQASTPRVFTTVRAGEVTAYAIAILPDPSSGVVQFIEWAGDRSAFVYLVEAAQRAYGVREVQAYIANGDQSMRGVLARHPVSWSEETNQGTLRVLNPTRLLDEMGVVIEELYNARLRLRSAGEQKWRVDWDVREGVSTPLGQDQILSGFSELSSWLFGNEGLCLPFARTDDLNYI